LVAASAPALAVAQGKPASDGLQQGVSQALAQAQSMWNEGSRASAIDLLRQALSRVEAASQDGANGAGSAPVAAVARELARMELAEGQVSNAFKLLVRLEPKIDQIADLWAMRANAAQRLGQHAEAAGSYQRALGLKADEPRWMLGLAVSLAAQGQTAQAAELAEKVRLMGALRPEIANYLRQLGVVIRSD
jgi:tetratricopeptide (TPR) repeat protein